MSFRPSGYSGTNVALRNEGEPSELDVAQYQAQAAKAQSWTAAIEGISALAVTGMTLGTQASALKKQQAHELKMAEQQEQLLGLQTQASSAQTAANRAAASLQALATTKTLLIVGGVVLTVGLVGAMVMASRGGDNDYYEDEYY